MENIVIQTNIDFTPNGKCRVKFPKHLKNGKKTSGVIAWYVGTKLYRYLDMTNENVALSIVWMGR